MVDDHPIVYEGLCQRLNSEPDLVVCGRARDSTEALLAIPSLKPDVILLDLALPGGHGLELLKDIRARNYQMPILVFTMYDDMVYALRAIKAGAQGYVTKRESSEYLVNALRTVLRGEFAVGPEVARLFVTGSARQVSRAGDPAASLGDRELEIFGLIGQGLGTRAIATRLGRSVKTVETYRARIKRKLQLKDSPALAREAVRWVESQGRA